MIKRNPRTAWRQYGDRVLIITPDDRKVHQLNETASFLWNLVGDGEVAEILLSEKLVQDFEVGPAQAKKDVARFVKKMVEKAILQEAN